MSSRPPEDDALPRTLVEAWQGDAAEPREVQRAYLQFLHKKAPKRGASVFLVARWVTLGIAIGMGSVYAATGPLHWFGARSSTLEAPTPTAPHAPAKLPAPARVQLAPQPVLPNSEPAPRERGLPLPPPSASAASEQWQRAAKGLRDKDFATANAALAELASQGTSAERESAQLVQAQLFVSQGRAAEAAQLLGALQTSAQSATIRQKASELLASLNESRSSSRSFAPAEGTNAP